MTDGVLKWQGEAGEPERPANLDKQAKTGGGPGDGVGPVCIAIVEGPLRAEIARSYLEQAGILVYLQGDPLGGVYGLVSGPLGSVRIFVPAAQAEEAAEIFAELDFDDTPNG